MRLTALAATLYLAAGSVGAQELLRVGAGDDGYLGLSDLAILSAGETRDDLDCRVEPLDPKLEYDLNFQAGYVARVPLAELAGSGDALRILFRVTSLDAGGEPVYFRERYNVPAIEEDAEGDATLPGKYRLGPGKYRVDWLMRDRAERVCSSTWEVLAETVEGFEKLASTADSSMVTEVSDEIFYDEPPVRRARGDLLHIKLLVNFTPSSPSSPSLSPYDMSAVVSMLRAISREPKIGRFSVAAYHLHEERVFYEQENDTRVDFGALGEAIENVRGGMIDLEKLQDEESSERFLKEMLEARLNAGSAPADAVIFLGPKLVFERNPNGRLMDGIAFANAPVFYFIYNRSPRSYPWRDALSVALRHKAHEEFTITSPKDFGRYLQQMLARLRQPESGS